MIGGGLIVIQCAPGTVIEHQGVRHVVEDGLSVVKGDVIYCTKGAFDALKAKAEESPLETMARYGQEAYLRWR